MKKIKKLFIGIISCLTAIFSVAGLAACATSTENNDSENMHRHNYEKEYISNPTCTEDGEVRYFCACGEEYNEIENALGHDWIDVVGTKTCNICGETNNGIIEEVTPEHTHDWIAATCTEPKTCNTCGETEGDALGHKYENRECGICGEKQVSVGLRYGRNNDEYIVTGIGSCTDKDVIIPETYLGLPVTRIAGYAFWKCDLTSVLIPDSVKTIGESAFWECTLSSAVIGDGVESIGKDAFGTCSLTNLVLGKGVKTIGSCAFGIGRSAERKVYYTGDIAGWCEIEFEDGNANPLLTGKSLYIDNTLVEGELVIPEGVTRIGKHVFNSYDKLKKIIIPDSVKSIGMGAFFYTGLTSIEIGDGLKNIEDAAFQLCRFTSVCYKGTVEEWNTISIATGNDSLIDAMRYYYSATEPTVDGNWWHYVDGEVVIWTKTEE